MTSVNAGRLAGVLMMKVVSWNLHALPPFRSGTRTRLALAAERLVLESADAVFVQEVWTDAAADFLRGKLVAAGYAVVGSPSGFGRSSGGLLTAVKRATFGQISHGTFASYRAHGPALKVWQGDGLANKGFLSVEARHDATGRNHTLVNTHLQSQYRFFRTAAGVLEAKDAYLDVRQSQIAQLAQWTSTLPADRFVLVAGDFNTFPEEWPTVVVPWQDLTAGHRASCRCATYLEATGPLAWLDYVFARQSAGATPLPATTRLIQNTSVDCPYSDHHGLVVEVQVDRGNTLAGVTAMLSRSYHRRQLVVGLVARLFHRAPQPFI
jgi:endonuclease/exonuclease/phosphatase family metal-dependent hydrolase